MGLVTYRERGWRSVARTLATGTAALAVVTIVAIWAAYGFRFAAAAGTEAGRLHLQVPMDYGQPPPKSPAVAWETVLHDPATAADRRGPLVPLLRAAHSIRLLPEAYLFGIAFVDKKSEGRAAYLRGEYSTQGFPSYFPWALAVKTPLATLLLFVGRPGGSGLSDAAGRRQLDPLAIGLGVFAAAYFVTLARSGLNIGYRHLLPVTAVLAIAAGGLAPSLFPARARRPLSVAVGAALAWLVAGTLLAAPHWIGYFNEAAGGWRNGHRYLADSNLDWGQDLLRLRARLVRESATTPVWLAQAGDPPLPQDLAVRWLWGDGEPCSRTRRRSPAASMS